MSLSNNNADKYVAQFESLVPELNDAWAGYRDEVFKEGAISVKEKQLIALACAYITGSDDCIKLRTKLAKENGCTDEEIAEAVYIA